MNAKNSSPTHTPLPLPYKDATWEEYFISSYIKSTIILHSNILKHKKFWHRSNYYIKCWKQEYLLSQIYKSDLSVLLSLSFLAKGKPWAEGNDINTSLIRRTLVSMSHNKRKSIKNCVNTIVVGVTHISYVYLHYIGDCHVLQTLNQTGM